MSTENPYVVIIPTSETTVRVTWGSTVRYRVKPNGKFECYIPAFDIYFSATSEEIVHKKAKGFTRMFFNHFRDEYNKINLKALVLKLHSIGFRSPMNDTVVNRFATNHIEKAKFRAPLATIPPAFYDSSRIDVSSELELA